MTQINTGRVILGGLAAGLVINISEAVLNLVVLGAENEALSASLGVDPVGGGGIAVYTIFAFLIGIVAVWLYAAMRPRLGAGPGAAVKTGVVVWGLTHVFRVVDFAVFLSLTGGFVTTILVWTLVETVLAVYVGAWLYQEEEGGAAAG